ncbi:SDR family NAD(P)-dependent oxidoreductase [Parapedobacter soli]|uniref:SDR family NAD(P)-dependent oxidoreductase n=1 Tax=Parapedobacter soli TaxID=416955 RepID=UPI0021C7CCAC|nr:SDR family oxidoreductase [Parapedobacter soli]
MNKKRTVLITGAAGGIGKAVALKFAEKGYALALVTRSNGADLLKAELDQITSDYTVFQGDLTDFDFVSGVVAKTVDRWGRLDVLVNNAAWRTLESMRTISLADWEKTIRVCLTAPAFLSRYAAEAMEKRGIQGSIINISSVMAVRAAGNSPAYVACKGAMEGLTRELAVLYGPRGIRVLALSPGQVDTAMSNDYTDGKQTNISRVLSENMNANTPLRRGGTPQEIANAVYWLASEEASFVNGTTLIADGGFVANFSAYEMKKLQLPNEF